MLGCILSTCLLLFLAPHYYISLYVGVAFMGFFLSWQFAAAFSWTSHHMNTTGKLSSIFFIGTHYYKISNNKHMIKGLGIGSLSSPPLAGWLFMLNPMYVIYSVGVMVFFQCIAVMSMYIISNKR